ncbi:MAG: Gfo/Idh/MocA family oxidoreductase [Armatimonadota bacterium]|nr:Gfo/Idh/MocA family oxidoreductase [Armatimonadota bacterium]MDR7405029.1 Gfo/Idh/MocA family oxidoreductase [Armatimonadota bacterium]
MLRVAVIGVGSIARSIYLPILLASNCTIAGVMSRTSERARAVAAAFNIPRVYETLDDVDADCAFVLTPKETHAAIASALLRRGIAVFLEKPMATTLADAEALAHTAEATGTLLMVGFNRRYAPAYEALHREWEHDPPEVMIAEKNRPGTEYRATLENAIHMIDLMRWICGEARDITAWSQFEDRYYETSCVAQIRFARTLGVLVANRSCGQWMERVATYGRGKSVLVEAPESVMVVDNRQGHVTNLTPLSMGWASVHDRLGFRQEVEQFLVAVRTGQPVRTPARDALETHRLTDRILRAAGLPDLSV